MRAVHLFSGGGGPLLLGDILGWRHVAAVDHDPACHFVLSRRWPDVELFENVQDFPAERFVGVDIVTAGWPCPPLSPAGKRLGSADPRDGWPHLVAAVRRLGPRFLFLENSTGALTAESGRYWSRCLADLAALGFDARWICVRGSEAGAPMEGDRLWIFCWRGALEAADCGGQGERDLRARRGQPDAPRGGEGGGASMAAAGRIGGEQRGESGAVGSESGASSEAGNTEREAAGDRRARAGDALAAAGGNGRCGTERSGRPPRDASPGPSPGDFVAPAEGERRGEGRTEPAGQQGELCAPRSGLPGGDPVGSPEGISGRGQYHEAHAESGRGARGVPRRPGPGGGARGPLAAPDGLRWPRWPLPAGQTADEAPGLTAAERGPGGPPESGLGGSVAGMADRPCEWPALAGVWPRGRRAEAGGSPQHGWEPLRLASGVSRRQDQIRILGNAWNIMQALRAWRLLTEAGP